MPLKLPWGFFSSWIRSDGSGALFDRHPQSPSRPPLHFPGRCQGCSCSLYLKSSVRKATRRTAYLRPASRHRNHLSFVERRSFLYFFPLFFYLNPTDFSFVSFDFSSLACPPPPPTPSKLRLASIYYTPDTLGRRRSTLHQSIRLFDCFTVDSLTHVLSIFLSLPQSLSLYLSVYII